MTAKITEGLIHMEFLGPPGVGKSTIHAALTQEDRFYDGQILNSVEREFLKQGGIMYTIPYRLTPGRIRNFLIEEAIQFRFRQRYLDKFISKNPKYLDTLKTIFQYAVNDSLHTYLMCKRAAERYQLGVSAVCDSEVLCLDEGFAQRAFSILWRCEDLQYSLKRYFDTVPIPDVLIHIDAPPDVCLDRQRKREDIVLEKHPHTNNLEQVQRKSRELCWRIRDHLADETSVITIENTGTVETVVSNLSASIDDF